MALYDFHLVFRELIFAASAPVSDGAKYEVQWRVAHRKQLKGCFPQKRPVRSQVLPFSEHVTFRHEVNDNLPELTVVFKVLEVLGDHHPHILDSVSFNLLCCPPLRPPAKTRVAGEHCTAIFFVFVRLPVDLRRDLEGLQVAAEVERIKSIRPALESLRIIVPEQQDGSTVKHPAYCCAANPSIRCKSLSPSSSRRQIPKKDLSSTPPMSPGPVSIASAVSEEFPDVSDGNDSSFLSGSSCRMIRESQPQSPASYQSQSPRSHRLSPSATAQTPFPSDVGSENRTHKHRRSPQTPSKEPHVSLALPDTPDEAPQTDCDACAVS